MDGIVSPEHFEQIKQVYPDVTSDDIRAIQDGCVNDVVIVNEERIFRFPKNDDWAADMLRQEIRVLELLNDQVTLALPRFDMVTDTFVSYAHIPGEPLYRWDLLRLSENRQDHLAAQLAEFFAQMHSMPLDQLRAAGIGPCVFNKTRDMWIQLFADLQDEVYPYMPRYSRRWVEVLFEPLLNDEHFMDYSPVLMNGDLACYHLMYNKPEACLNGVIDFGTAGIGDPAHDYACLIYYLGETFLARIARYYPAIEEGADRARFWSGTLELQWALEGIRQHSLGWHMHMGDAKDISLFGAPLRC